MMNLWNKLLTPQVKELFFYGIFGVLTTIINIIVFWLLSDVVGIYYMIANVIAWVAAVVAAFVTNKYWVFGSRSWKRSVWLPECVQFVSARLATGLIDMFIMFVMISVMGIREILAKMVANVFVIISNYMLSKLWIFKK